jgi:hypothetical protein
MGMTNPGAELVGGNLKAAKSEEVPPRYLDLKVIWNALKFRQLTFELLYLRFCSSPVNRIGVKIAFRQIQGYSKLSISNQPEASDNCR